MGTRLAAALRGSEASRSLVVFRMIAVLGALGGFIAYLRDQPSPSARWDLLWGRFLGHALAFRRGSGGDPKANSTWSRPGLSSSLLAIIGLDVEGLTPGLYTLHRAELSVYWERESRLHLFRPLFGSLFRPLSSFLPDLLWKEPPGYFVCRQFSCRFLFL